MRKYKENPSRSILEVDTDLEAFRRSPRMGCHELSNVTLFLTVIHGDAFVIDVLRFGQIKSLTN
ncbi:hypothetical protein QCA50_015465 [Cerrena zonata]|uniref:Uncharacterized protein n=1 Tax=Cerrena zonata TaxID=2478898 RepID=A0AAW0FP81_9APHY